jgi:GntR family transcriptional regulator/MocR family aminotransferase
MPKRAKPTPRPEIELDANLSMPLYRQLYQRLRSAILSGQLERGARLPSTRTLASELGVSRNTTALAYDQLLMEGYIESRVGHGTIVSRQLPEFQPVMAQRQASKRQHKARATNGTVTNGTVPNARATKADAPTPVATRVHALRHLYQPADPEFTNKLFRGGQPALELFPYDLWARLIARHARKTLPKLTGYQPTAGYAPLREAIAAHIGITRGVRCSPDQVILTAGSQGALDLAVRTLLNPGDAAWVENPGYFGAQGALLTAGARLVPVPVDNQGLDIASGVQRCPTARLVSTTPSHQFPTGVTMSLSRRLALLEWAREAKAWIIEDDYDGEYRFGGRPLEALQGLDQAGRVLYIGTFSKVLFPALRLGFLIAPEVLIEPLLTVRRHIDMHVPILEQLALTDFMQEGHFARHLRHMLQHYQRRRNLLLNELQQHLGDLLEVSAPEVGMHLVGWLPPGKDDCRAAELANQAGLAVTPLSRHSLEPLPRGGLVFGFASTDEEGIRVGVHKLAEALAHL